MSSYFSTNTFVNINFNFAIEIRMKIVDLIIFVQMKIKRNYDDKHKSIYMRKKNYVLIKLHYEYDIFFIVVFESKFNQ